MLTPEEVSRRYPIGAIAVYLETKTAVLLRSSPIPEKSLPPKGKRKHITELSKKSLDRFQFLVQTTSVNLLSMLTLTYLCPPTNGREAKEHLRQLLQWLRRRCGENLEYVWFAEFTKMYSLHFHVLLDCKPDEYDRLELAYRWMKITNQGLGRYCALRTRKEMRVLMSIMQSQSHENAWNMVKVENGAKRYVAKYAGKPHQKRIPEWFQDMGRFWGVSKGIKTNRYNPVIYTCDEDTVRELLAEQKCKVANWDVLPKYLWNVDPAGLQPIEGRPDDMGL